MTARLPRTAFAAGLTTVTLALGVTACGSDDGSQTADDPTTTSAAATTGAATTGPTTSSSAPTAASSSATPTEGAVAVYDVGTTPQGPRLFREFRPSPGTDPATAAVQMLAEPPTDPDYRTAWPAGSLSSPTMADGQIDVTVDSSLAQRPASMSAAQAELAVQQVVYTLQAAAQQQLPVRFLVGDAPAATVLGVPTADPVAAADFLDVLALVNVTTPVQNAVVSGRFTADGVASSFEGTVPWEVLDSDGKKVLHGSAQAAGYLDKLYPWTAAVDVSGLAPGDYTFVAMTDDPSGGEGPGPTQDTKSFTVS